MSFLSQLFPSQHQTTSRNSTAIQAGGDMHIHSGMSVTETKEVIKLFIADYLPALRAEAREAAVESATKWAHSLDQKLVSSDAEIDLRRFADPDVAMSVNTAAQAVARQRNGANPDVLADLIVERVKARTVEFESAVIREAIETVVKLTAPQIAVLTLLTFLDQVEAFSPGVTLSDAKRVVEKVEILLSPIKDFNAAKELRYLTSLGVLQRNHFMPEGEASFDGAAQVKMGFSHLLDVKNVVRPKSSSRQWRARPKRSLPTFSFERSPAASGLIDLARAHRLAEFEPTSTGLAIAGLNLRDILPDVPFERWLETI